MSGADGDLAGLCLRDDGDPQRQVSLGEGLDAEGIEADYTDGVLTLRVPVAEKAQPRKISVGTGSAPDSPAIEATADAN